MSKVVQLISLCFVVGILLPFSITTYIEPDEIGVRRSLFGGINEEDIEQGRALDLWFLHSYYRLPRGLHYQQFLGPNALEIRTKENNVFFFDATVIYQIVPGEGHQIVVDGLMGSYDDKVRSVSYDFMLKHLGRLSPEDAQNTQTREEAALSAIEPLNKKIAQFHVRVIDGGVVLRGFRFLGPFERKLQDLQKFAVDGKLDVAMTAESKAIQGTETVEKAIDKDLKLKTEEWNTKIEDIKSKYEIEIANIDAKGVKYDSNKRADADSFCSKAQADGDLAEAKATALGKELESAALSTKAGRVYSAIEAVRNFKLGDILLNSYDPHFLMDFASMGSWKRFFLGRGR